MRPLFALMLLGASLIGCRTTDDNTPPAVAAKPAEPQQPDTHNGKTVLLKRVVGALTQSYAENKQSECVVYREDTKDADALLKDLAEIKGQRLQDGFIFRPQIPSIQIYGYVDKEAILLQEIGAEKATYRMPNDPNSAGNPKLSLALKTIKEFCGDAQ